MERTLKTTLKAAVLAVCSAATLTGAAAAGPDLSFVESRYGDVPETQTVKAPVNATTSTKNGKLPWDGAYVGVELGIGRSSTDGTSLAGTVGVQTGRDWRQGNFVVGLGVDTHYGQIVTKDADIQSLSRVKLRGGYVFGETMAFASVGASYATSHEMGNSWGHSVGVGFEHRMTENTFLTGEIVQHQFDRFDSDHDIKPATARLGVNFRF